MSPRVNIYFNQETFSRLNDFVKRKYGEDANARSLTVNQAVREFLADQGQMVEGELQLVGIEFARTVLPVLEPALCGQGQP